MKYFIFLLFFVGVFTMFAQTQNPNLPNPPEGYSWQSCPEIKAYFLKPDGWFFKEKKTDKTLSYFITKEDIAANNSFETGLSVNVIANFRNAPEESAYKYALEFYKSAKEKSDVQKEWLRDMGPFKSIGFLVLDKKAPPVKISYLLIANMKTNTLYLFSYEAPLKDWDNAWKTGEPILKQLMIDDTL